MDEDTYLNHTTTADYAEDVAKVAAHIGKPCVVVGHSMGGMVTQVFTASALAAGQQVAALVLLASTAPAQLGSAVPTPFPPGQPFLFDRETTTNRYFHDIPPDRLERALDRLVPESVSVVNEILAPPGISIEPSDITCPVLSVTAEFDRTAVKRDGSLAAYYGGDHIHDDQHGHDLMLESGWEPLLRRILAWIGDKVPQS